jgi:excinuclease ABC subunit A
LHFEDVRKLLEVLHRLVEQGNTVVVIEHNLDVIKTADHVIDLGPGGGVNGGRIVVTGTPENVAAEPKSFTGQYLKPLLERSSSPAKAGAQPNKDSSAHAGTQPAKKTRRKPTESDPDQPDLIAAK